MRSCYWGVGIWTMRLFIISVIILGSGLLGLYVLGPGVTGITPDGFVTITSDRALRHDIRSSIRSSDIEREIDLALSRADHGEALMYREIAEFARIPLRIETVKALSTISPSDQLFSEEYNIPLQADNLYRILAMEGSKLLAGESFDQFALGLAVANLSSRSADSSATSPKNGIDLIHAAHMSQKLNADFSAYINQLIQTTVNFSDVENALTSTRIADQTATLTSLKDQVSGVDSAELNGVSQAMDKLSDRVGPGHAINLMSYVRSPEDLTALLTMSNVLKERTYAIVKLTGRISLGQLSTEIPFKEFVSRNALAFIIWASGLVLALVGRHIFRSRWRRLTLDDDPQPEPIDPIVTPYPKDPKIKKARV